MECDEKAEGCTKGNNGGGGGGCFVWPPKKGNI